MKKLIRRYFPWAVKPISIFLSFFRVHYRKSYSQFGEDMVLSSLIWDKKIKKGFYVDIGCFEPKKYSNTYFYYKKGWCGINVDARPGSMRAFNKYRKRDINIETGISDECKELNYYCFNELPYNTFSYEMALAVINNGIGLIKKEVVQTIKLEQLFERYLPLNQHIDFLSIDVEGFDLKVLKSNNWDKYKPTFILVEMHDIDLNSIAKSDIYQFLNNLGYELASVAYITFIFELKNIRVYE